MDSNAHASKLLSNCSFDSDGTLYKNNPFIVFNKLHSLRLLGTKGQCDFIVKTGGQEFFVHSLVMSAQSDFFAAAMMHPMIESEHRVVELNSISPKTFQLVLDFFYQQQVTINKTNVYDLIDASYFLLITQLQQVCTAFLSRMIDDNSCLDIWRLGKLYCNSLLESTGMNHVLLNFLTVSKKPSFCHLSLEELLFFVARDNIKVLNEEQVFEAVFTWVVHDKKHRECHFPQLLQHLRLAHLPADFLRVEISAGRIPLGCTETNGIQTTSEEKRHSYSMSDTLILKKPWGSLVAVNIDTEKEFVCLRQDKKQTPYATVANDRVFVIRHLSARKFSDAQRFSVESMRQIIKPVTLHSPRERATFVAHGNTLYLIGGRSGKYLFVYMECYDTHSNIWRAYAGPSDVRYNHLCAVYKDYIYVYGGCTLDGNVESPVKTLEVYDIANEKWSYLASSPVYITSGKMVAVQDHLIIATSPDERDCQEHMQIYSIEKDRWSVIQKLPFPNTAALKIFVHGEKLHFPIYKSLNLYVSNPCVINIKAKKWKRTHFPLQPCDEIIGVIQMENYHFM